MNPIIITHTHTHTRHNQLSHKKEKKKMSHQPWPVDTAIYISVHIQTKVYQAMKNTPIGNYIVFYYGRSEVIRFFFFLSLCLSLFLYIFSFYASRGSRGNSVTRHIPNNTQYIASHMGSS